MPSTLPDGEAAPDDGRLPESALQQLADHLVSAYVHVPFCRVRCGYCDFNTYAPGETDATPSRYAAALLREIELARAVLVEPPVLDTVFFGGGTPTLLSAETLTEVLAALGSAFGLADDAEVSIEANPDSVTLESLSALREGGFNRISFGMQSSVPQVLAVLDRTHDPERVPQAVAWAREAGFDQLSLDLIYGTPGESVLDWEASLAAALACRPDHISAYSLIVEPGTALARRVRRGELPAPDDDDLADKYLLADQTIGASGLEWYEVSNWARSGAECRHNLNYWRSANWWGFGPGAHSHVGGVRWWNRKLPTDYASRLESANSPALARELLSAADRNVERILLEVRLRDGLPLALVDASAVGAVVADGLAVVHADRLVLTDPGRLLADAVVRRLVG